ncbi:MAG: polysaccharide biosynthesis C-terminal domain-containing protein [Ignavibacteriales bacterium]|nr:polysaccharide biosynthesis C-terminal domain-containing protein [Ignavibacteriales bacterium]
MIDKLKQLSKETVVYGISTVVGRFLNFVLVPFYSNIFNPADMGVMANLYAYMAIFNIVFIYGMDSAYLKMGSLKESKGSTRVFTTSYMTILLSTAVFSILLFLSKPWLGMSVSADPAVVAKYEHLISYSINILALDALTVLPFIWLRLQNKAMIFSKIRVINILINIGMNFILVLGFKMGVEAVFISNLIASGYSFLALTPYVYGNLSTDYDFSLLKRILKFGLPFLPAGMAAMLMQVIDKPIVERLTNLDTLGIYNANYKLGIFMMLFVSMFQFAWQPFFLKHASDDNAGQLFARVFTYFTIAGSIIVVFLSLFIEDITAIGFGGVHFLGEAYWSGRNIIPVILLGYLFYGFYVNFNASFYIKEKSIPIPVLLGAGAVVNVGLNFLLIPMMGIMGAALATLGSYVVISGFFFWYGRKLFEIDYEFRKIFSILGLITVIFIIYYSFISGQEVSFFIKLLIALGFVGSIILTGALSLREIKVMKEMINGFTGRFRSK